MRLSILAVSLALAAIPAAPAMAQVSLSFNTPGLSIGVNIPTYPDFERVPDYPVYYTPGLATNLFYYDGMYWLLQDDNWYASTWYNGPWQGVGAQDVPLFVLRVPVRYYRSPPAYFRGWQGDAPPRWDDHWGPDWSQRHRGWDQWNRRDAPRPAPLPTYQRQYSGARYPQAEQQRVIRQQNDKYQPHDAAVRQRIQQAAPPAPAKAPRAAAPQPPDQQRAQREQPSQREPEQQKPQQRAQPEKRTQQEPEQQKPQQRAQPEKRTQQEPVQVHKQPPQEQPQRQQGQQPAQPQQQQRQQPPAQQQQRTPQERQQAPQNKAQQPAQEQHDPGRAQERPAPAAREPARDAKPAPERNQEHDRPGQGNEDKK